MRGSAECNILVSPLFVVYILVSLFLFWVTDFRSRRNRSKRLQRFVCRNLSTTQVESLCVLCILERCSGRDMNASVWSVVVYLLAAVDPCAPAGVLDCAPGRFSVRYGDCAIMCVVLAYATGRALTLLCAAAWRPTTTSVVEAVAQPCWLPPAAASTRLLAVRPRRFPGALNP